MEERKYYLLSEGAGRGSIRLSKSTIIKSFMVLLFEERNSMKMIGDPQVINFSDGTSIKVEREINTLSITFSDGTTFIATEDEIRNFHYALTCLEANEIIPGTIARVRIKGGGSISITEEVEQNLIPGKIK